MATSRTITVFDDRSSLIVYSKGWNKTVTDAYAYDKTLVRSNTPGSNATLTFIGMNIAVMGKVSSMAQTLKLPAPVSSYSIDGGPNARYEAKEQSNSSQYNVTFFEMDGLQPDVNHTLVITVQSEGSFYIDSIRVTSTTASIPFTGNSLQQAASNTRPDLRLVNGPLIGGICFLALGIGVIWAIGKQMRDRRSKQTALEEGANPFVLRDRRTLTSPPSYSESVEHESAIHKMG